MEIKTSSPEDYDLIREFLVEIGWGARVGNSERFRKLMEHTARAVVAWDGSRVIGFARALCDEVSNGYVSMVAVSSEHRGQGVGRKLIESLIGDDPNITWVLRAKPGSEAFWDTMGFKVSNVARERERTQK
jgi:GNAT superfamily N-acetyltransferase